MENVQESRAIPKNVKTGLHSGSSTKAYKYALGILVVLSAILGWRVITPAPKVIEAVVAPPAPTQVQATGVARHSTLSAEVFRRFVTLNSQRMYPRLSREIVQAAIKYSDKYDLSPILVLAVAEAESEYYPFAISKKDAKGLMQINPQANQQLLIQAGIFQEVSDIFDPERNIEAGCYLLRKFINESSDLDTALDKYLGADSIAYKSEIHGVMGKILLLGITEELNKTSPNKIKTIEKVEAPPKPHN